MKFNRFLFFTLTVCTFSHLSAMDHKARLFAAAAAGDAATTRSILAEHPELANARNEDGKTPLGVTDSFEVARVIVNALSPLMQQDYERRVLETHAAFRRARRGIHRFQQAMEANPEGARRLGEAWDRANSREQNNPHNDQQ